MTAEIRRLTLLAAEARRKDRKLDNVIWRRRAETYERWITAEVRRVQFEADLVRARRHK
jgi:hypothetical protein